MENKNKNILIAQKIGKINEQRINKKHFTWISDISFNVKEKETISFIFTSSNEKKAFISIFLHNKSNFLGYFEYKDKIYYSESKEKLSSISSYNDMQVLNQFSSNAINFLFNEDMIKEQIKEYELLLNEEFKLSTFLKNNVLVQSKKIEIEYFSKINQEIQNVLESFVSINKNTILNQEKNDKNIFNIKLCLNSYNQYLKKRIEFLYKRNSKIINLYIQYFNGDTNKNQIIINNKINKLTDEIEELSKKINYSKKQELVSWKDEFKNQIKELKLKNIDYLNFLNQEFKYLSIKYKYRQKKSISKDLKISNYFNYIISDFYKNEIKKIKKNILYLSNEDIKDFLNVIQKTHNDGILEAPLLPKKMNKKYKTKKIILKWIKSEFDLIKKTYSSKSKQNLIQIKANLISKFESDMKTKEKNFSYTSNIQLLINQKKYEKQKYIDEYVWNNTSVNIGISSEMMDLNNEAFEQIEIYKKLKTKLSSSLKTILSIFNSINEKSMRKNLSNKLSKLNFNREIDNIENIYLYFKNDINLIDDLIKGNNIEENQQKFLNILIKYKTFNLALKNKLTILELFKEVKQLNELEKSKILLTKSLLHNKNINIFNNLTDNLSENDLKIFEEIYTQWVDSQNSIWIQISNKINSIQSITNQLYVIYNTKSVEFGVIEKIISNPKHWYTKKILGIKSKKNEKIPKYNVFEEFDFYKVEDHHFIFTKLEDYWDEYKQYLEPTIWTNKVQQLELFNIDNKQKHANKIDNSSKIKLNTEYIESTIIDVRKKI